MFTLHFYKFLFLDDNLPYNLVNVHLLVYTTLLSLGFGVLFSHICLYRWATYNSTSSLNRLPQCSLLLNNRFLLYHFENSYLKRAPSMFAQKIYFTSKKHLVHVHLYVIICRCLYNSLQFFQEQLCTFTWVLSLLGMYFYYF